MINFKIIKKKKKDCHYLTKFIRIFSLILKIQKKKRHKKQFSLNETSSIRIIPGVLLKRIIFSHYH